MATDDGLTPRQREVQALVHEGLKAEAIAEKLGITPNAVYQQIRKIRKLRGTSGQKASKAPATKKPAKKVAAKPTAAKPSAPRRKEAAPAPVDASTPAEVPAAPLTPLQAIRARRKDIDAQAQKVASAVADARAALDAAVAAEKRVTDKYADELLALDQAESALTGKEIVDGKVVKTPVSPSTPAAVPENVSEPETATSDETAPSGDSPSLASVPDPEPEATDDPAELARRGDAQAAADAASAAAEAPQD